jgi:hypothetical protein
MTLHELAKLGAQNRIKELREEIAKLQSKFGSKASKKLHWTQRPENKRKLNKVIKENGCC